jgi:type II secretory ATPase GspE/PulE/Tfp pilus assembly ATPase PilB-like protein
MAQRLLRRVCRICKGTALDPSANGERCENCFGTGYRGRVAVYEIMTMTDELRRMTAQNSDAISLGEEAKRGGFQTMHEDARNKAEAGLTTMEEIRRVLF